VTDQNSTISTQFFPVGADQRSIAVAVLAASGSADAPVLVWLGGYRSDMSGAKAIALEGFARGKGLGCVRFDYSGHGQSGGSFGDGTISRWLEEAMAVVSRFGAQRMILVGSSMGGWISLRLIEELRKTASHSVCGLVLIAPAPDFTCDLIEPHLSLQQKQDLAEKGFFAEHSDYSLEPNIFTRALLEDGRANRVLTGIIDTGCPVHILQGMQDPDVPFQHALKLVEHLPSDDVCLTLIRDGDHRLSRPQDLDRMLCAIGAMIDMA
jgi:pimeloyl-ACP methyl ester carboxylesterase